VNRRIAIFLAVGVVSLAPTSAHAEESPYKGGEGWPERNFEGADFLEPFVPLAALDHGDGGRIVLDTAVPYALLGSAFAFQNTDRATLQEIRRWKWVGIDQKADNYPVLLGFVALSGLSMLLPSPEDGATYSWDLRLDRATVFALGMAAAELEDLAFAPIFHRLRPDRSDSTSRPSGHTLAAAAAASFFADVLRDTLHPQDETNLALRLVEEVGCALPYLGAGYVALERIHGSRHYLTDTLLGAALGSFTMHLLHSWSFTRLEQHTSWFDSVSLGWDPDQKGMLFAVSGSF